jgi:hypothetical protein
MLLSPTLKPHQRFTYEEGAVALAASIATDRGSLGMPFENMAFVGFGSSQSAASQWYNNSFPWDGAAPDWHVGGEDNTQDEHIGGAMALCNVTGDDYVKTASPSFASVAPWAVGYLRLIGGFGPVSRVAVGGKTFPAPAYPNTKNYSLVKGDIVVYSFFYRAGIAWSAAASGMTELMGLRATSGGRYIQVFVAEVQATGTFSTTGSATVSQQAGEIITAFRPS